MRAAEESNSMNPSVDLQVGDTVIVKVSGRRARIRAVLSEDHYQVEYLPDPADDPIDRDSPVPEDEGGVYFVDDLQPLMA
jgi:hypothetical protein